MKNHCSNQWFKLARIGVGWCGVVIILVGAIAAPALSLSSSSLSASSLSASDAHSNTHSIPVTTLADSGVGSLRWAIAQSNRTPADDVIDLTKIHGTIALKSSLPTIAGNVRLDGDGDDVISGENAHQILSVERGKVEIKQVTIANGLAQGHDGFNGAGGAAGMGGGLFIQEGHVTLKDVSFVHNRAIGGMGTSHTRTREIGSDQNTFKVNRGAVIGVNGIHATHQSDALHLAPDAIKIATHKNRFNVNRGAIANVNGIGIGGIGSIAFGGGGGFGGFGNAGNGGNGGNSGASSGNGGNGGDGGNGGIGIFGDFGLWNGQGGVGTVAFGGGGGFGGFGNAGNGGNGSNGVDIARGGFGGGGGNGGNGGNGGFGGGGGSGGFGGKGGSGTISNHTIAPQAGNAGNGGFGGGDGGLGFGGSGGGFGGAIFIRSGTLILDNTRFERNTAIAGQGSNPGLGKGGAIFSMTESLKKVAQVAQVPQVIALKQRPIFENNNASDAGSTITDNRDVYGQIQFDP